MTKESRLFSGVITKLPLLILALAGLFVVAMPERLHAEVDPYANRPLVISNEFGGSSVANPVPTPNQANANENSFITSPLQSNGSEGSFNTAPSANRPLVISNEFGGRTSGQTTPGEGSFTTIPTTPGEGSFTTASNGGGCTENCGGGGGGGGGGSGSSGGGRRRVTPPPSPLPEACPLYLREFIKLGRANDKIEVLKLQYFLRTYENLEVPLSGIYDETTYEAVKIFQSRYGRDVLGPWGISEPTGYVFITTRLAINNIYCARTTANNLDLRNFYPNLSAAQPTPEEAPIIREGEGNLEEVATSTIPTDIMGAAEESPFRNFFQAAAVGLVDWLGDWCHFANLLLLLIILALALWIIKLQRELESWKNGQHTPPDLPVAGIINAPDTPAEEGVLKNLDRGDDWDTWLDDEDKQPTLDKLD